MAPEGRPIFGFSQPGIGFEVSVALSAVRRTKRDKAPSPLRALVARTVTMLRDRKYQQLDNVTARNRGLAKDADVSFSTIQRICSGEVGATVDMLDSIATALEVRPQDLLTPFFAARPPAEADRPDFPAAKTAVGPKTSEVRRRHSA